MSALLFTGCVKKEEPKSEESQAEPTATQQAEISVAPTPSEDVVTLEALPSTDTAEANHTSTVSETQHTRTEITTRPATVREASTTPAVETTVVSEQPKAETPKPAAPVAAQPKAPVDNNEAASIDDAVAEAMKAAQPAIQ